MSLVIGVRTNVGEVPMASAFTWRHLITSDGTSTGTATNLTGRTYTFVIRRIVNGRTDQTAAGLILSKTSAASEITYTSVNGTSDAADVAILSTDLPIATTSEGNAEWALWRTDNPSDRPEASGLCKLVRIAAQS